MPDLTEQLRTARADLLRQIDVPELGAVRSRARTIRRRRQGLRAGASALALIAVVGVVSVVVRGAGGGQTAPVGTAQPTASAPEQAVWRGGGLTLNGLDGPVIDLPGVLVDVQFADRERAYALAADCPEGGGACGIALAASTDGGHSWQEWSAPVDEALPADLPRLVTVGTAGVALLGLKSYFRPSDGPQWTEMPYASTVIDQVSAAGRLTVGATEQAHDCTGLAALRVLLPDGTNAELRRSPDLTVCRVAPARAADGSWWVSGYTVAGPAVAVSRNDGQDWNMTPLPPGTGQSSFAQVATVGSDVYATVVSTRTDSPTKLTIDAVYRANAADPTFKPYAGKIGTVEGEVVPTPDGRLVAAGPNWYVSDEPGATMHGAGGTLPWVGRIQRSPGGWVAYNLFDYGWVATSLDGRSWQKINLR